LIKPPGLPVVNQQYWALKNFRQRLFDTREQALCLVMTSEAMDIAEFCSVLSKEELQRMEKLRFSHDQQQYAAAHWLKRTAVGGVTRQAPHTLDFSINRYGKPSLRTPGLRFNISHSGGFVALLLSRYGDVGVDIEFPRPGMDFNLVLPLIAHPQEYGRISGRDEFYRLWTLKEAICKANGKGLSLAPRTFELCPGDAGSFVALCDRQQWLALSHPLPEGGYLACAFATKPNDLSIVQLN
jgi:4'-phosphopantetheinyl transferase